MTTTAGTLRGKWFFGPQRFPFLMLEDQPAPANSSHLAAITSELPRRNRQRDDPEEQHSVSRTAIG
jgi:hypothetical protein